MNLPVALLQLWMIALFLFGISYLWRGNIFFTFTMQLIVGALTANQFIISYGAFVNDVWNPMVAGNYIKLLYIIFGSLLFATFFTKWRWITRYPTAILLGVGLGLELRNILWTDVLAQIQMSIVPISSGNLFGSFSNIVNVAALALSLFYFMFALELKGRWVKIHRVARLLMMLAMGTDAGLYFFFSSTNLLTVPFMQVKKYVDQLMLSLA